MKLEWCWKRYDELCRVQIHDIFKIRQEVFVIEQNCLYQDIDGLDIDARHLFVYMQDKLNKPQIAAYLRVLPPQMVTEINVENDVHIGRVLVAQNFRGLGIAKPLMMKGIEKAHSTFTGKGIRISAQLYLQKFYQGLGFEIVGEPYDEDGIEHIEMFNKANP